VRKFFVEAKKPSVNIKQDIEPAFQLRRYAYTAKLPLSILTDFEEFAVYDTRIKPDKHDQASTARIFYCTYDEYEKEFDFIFNTFSRQAILKGSFDQYIEDTKRKKGTSEVDKEFLKFIEKWRENLAKNIALRNKNLTIYELNYAVQKIIDRIIFLRIAEDRHVEDYGKIQKLLENKKTIYPQLVNLFLQADVKYDSGLFNFKADQYTPELKIDDKILKDIIKSIYYPDSPYEFSVFDVEILGNIYEQFLGKTIRLTASHQAKIENKPEVKKAGGVYYTPKYIVDYIVKNTVGEKIKNKTPDQISKLKILDPACGSGSFLLGAYQMLMNYHLEYYTKDKNIKKSLKENKIYQIKENECRLTIEEKHRILLNNIFGVDIDSQAVEVTKLSLLLKLMEGESQESAGMLFKFSDIKMLPDLSENIKCGNSLIGSDFYETSQMNLFQDEETTRRINVFDWPQEFPDIFKSGGFDIVIGNPPYLGRSTLFTKEEKEYIKLNFLSSEGKYEIYHLFMERAITLLKKGGYFSFITPQTWLSIKQAAKLRKHLLQKMELSIIVYIKQKVFNVSVDNVIFIFYYGKGPNAFKIFEVNENFINETKKPLKFIYKEKVMESQDFLIDVFFEDSVIDLKNKIDMESIYLETICYVKDGVKIVGPAKSYAFTNKKEDDSFFPMLKGNNIKKYFFKWKNLFCCRDKNEIEKHKPTDIRLRDEFIFRRPKILIRKTGHEMIATYENKNYYYEQSLFSISKINLDFHLDLKFILGIINSKLSNFLLKINPFSKKTTFPQIRLHWLKKFPIKNINLSNFNERKQHDKMVEMVDQMLDVQKKYHSAKLENEQKMYKKQIDILENQIDKLVYKLYELTDEEIKIVEGEK